MIAAFFGFHIGFVSATLKFATASKLFLFTNSFNFSFPSTFFFLRVHYTNSYLLVVAVHIAPIFAELTATVANFAPFLEVFFPNRAFARITPKHTMICASDENLLILVHNIKSFLFYKIS